jgi:hypothetical protein
MLSIYLISIGLFYLSLILFILRMVATRKQLNIKKGNKSGYFLYLRTIIISVLPIINLIITIWGLYGALLMSDEKYIELMNK